MPDSPRDVEREIGTKGVGMGVIHTNLCLEFPWRDHPEAHAKWRTKSSELIGAEIFRTKVDGEDAYVLVLHGYDSTPGYIVAGCYIYSDGLGVNEYRAALQSMVAEMAADTGADI